VEKLAGEKTLDECRDTLQGVCIDALDEDPSVTWRDPAAEGALPSFAAKGGPTLDTEAYLRAIDAVELWRLADRLTLEPTTWRSVRHFMEAAYKAGRAMREAEFPSDLARNRIRKRARARAAETGAWHVLMAKWAQTLVDGWPSGQKLNNTTLGEALDRVWGDRPFQGEGEPQDCPERVYLVKTLIPAWRAGGLLHLPKKDG
jgi:hypothetical protein